MLPGVGYPEADGSPVGITPVCAAAIDSKERDAISFDMILK